MELKDKIAMKTISVAEALAFVKSDTVISSAMAAAEPKLFLSQLHTIADRVENVRVSNCLPFEEAPFFLHEQYKKNFKVESWFYTGAMRKAVKNGNITHLPTHLHHVAIKRLTHQVPDIFVGTASMPDKHGFVSLSLSNVYEKRFIDAAKISILEINENFPRTFGDLEVHIDDIDYLIQADYEAPTLPTAIPSEKDLVIGKLIAERINDGDCLQLGIGGIPNAVAASLLDKKDLGIHTEMFTSGMMDLIKAGAVTGRHKQLHRGKHVAAFALGTKELYEFIDDNPSVIIMDGNWANDPYVIAQNDNQVSINTTIEIDLTGQCASESIGSMQFSGSGGQADTAIGAQKSKNGRSFIALYSTAMVKNKETGEREEISKIVPFLKPGAAVTLQRNDVDMVVTEYGIAQLRGTSIEERVERLIQIAHPKFRAELRAKAQEIGLVFN